MSRISVTQQHNKPVEEVRTLVHSLADNLAAHYDLRATWPSDSRVEFSRHGVSGFLSFSDSDVVVELKLGLMATPFKGKIRAELEKAMAKHLA